MAVAIFIWRGFDTTFDAKFETFETKIGTLSENQKSGFQNIDEDLDRVENHFDEEFDEVERRFTAVGESIEAIRSEMRSEFDSVSADIKDVRKGLDDLKDDVHAVEMKIAEREENSNDSEMASATENNH